MWIINGVTEHELLTVWGNSSVVRFSLLLSAAVAEFFFFALHLHVAYYNGCGIFFSTLWPMCFLLGLCAWLFIVWLYLPSSRIDVLLDHNDAIAYLHCLICLAQFLHLFILGAENGLPLTNWVRFGRFEIGSIQKWKWIAQFSAIIGSLDERSIWVGALATAIHRYDATIWLNHVVHCFSFPSAPAASTLELITAICLCRLS